MKLRYNNKTGESFVKLSKQMISLLDIKRHDKFFVTTRRSTYAESNRQTLELVAILERRLYEHENQPLRTICQINVTRFLDVMGWTPHMELNLSLDGQGVGQHGKVTLTFDHPCIVYGIPDFTSLDEKSLRTRIFKYKAKVLKLELQADGLAYETVMKLPEPDQKQTPQPTSGANEKWADALGTDLELDYSDLQSDI